MTRMSSEIVAEGRSVTQRGAYSIEARGLAYEVWAFRAGRNAAETARILRAECEETHAITDRVIRSWVVQEDWGARANADLEELAPNIYGGIVTDLLHGAQAGANYLRRVNEGDRAAMDKNGRVDVARVTAANIALQASGFSPRTTGDQLQAPKQASNELKEFVDAAEANRYWIKGGKTDEEGDVGR
jgi:hypothetical protein